jgi:hypothetical protein
MGIISVSLPTDGTTADDADVNTPLTTIVNEFNGNIDNANIKSGAAIAGSKIASDGGLSNLSAGSGYVVQTVSTNYSAVATGTTTIPFDDTIPQITEGTEFMTRSITPTSATNRLSITATFYGSYSVTAEMVVALFQDATANGLAGNSVTIPTGGYLGQVKLTHDMVAGTTSSTTFRVRAGGSTAGTVTFNGTAGTRKLGGITLSNITITEYRP